MCPTGACSLSFGLTFERLVWLSRIPPATRVSLDLHRVIYQPPFPFRDFYSLRDLWGGWYLGEVSTGRMSEEGTARSGRLAAAKEWNLTQAVVPKSDDF